MRGTHNQLQHTSADAQRHTRTERHRSIEPQSHRGTEERHQGQRRSVWPVLLASVEHWAKIVWAGARAPQGCLARRPRTSGIPRLLGAVWAGARAPQGRRSVRPLLLASADYCAWLCVVCAAGRRPEKRFHSILQKHIIFDFFLHENFEKHQCLKKPYQMSCNDVLSNFLGACFRKLL